MTERLPIAAIKIGPRHRRHPGDIEGLARSIRDVSLLHPVVVGRDGTLIAGARRLAACKLLGWTDVPVTIINLESVVRGEYAENIERKDFTWSESVAIKREVEALEKPAAKERLRKAGRLGGKGSGKLPEASKGRAADKAAKATGRKRRTLEKAEAVIVAAEIDSKRFGDLAERLDEDNARVDVIHRELKQRKARASYEARIEKGSTVDDLQALAASGYRASVIYVDVPSRFETYSGKGKQRSPERHYDTMTIAELKAMGPLIRSLAAHNCTLLYWTSGPHNKNALEVIEAWGFAYKTWAFVWVKTNPSSGLLKLEDLQPEDLHRGNALSSTQANAELVLLATRGSPTRLANDVHQVVIAPVGETHSEKPEEVARRIERLYPGPYLELFGRRARENWTVWGNELPPASPASNELSAPAGAVP